MHDYLLSVLLGIVEGLTEFLPVSSTAHLRISEALLHIHLDDPFWKMYSIVIQLGAILCLPIYFRARIARILDTVQSASIAFGIVLLVWLPFCLFCFPQWLAAFKRSVTPSRSHDGDRTWLTHPLSLVMIAFVCTAVPSLLLTKLIGKHLESLTVMGTSLLVGGIVMWIVDAYFGSPRTVGRHMTERMEDVSLVQAVWIGICQVASAVFPGTSRSMATIAAGQVAGMSRTAALEFSFFLSMPTMIAATGYDLLKTFHPKHGAEALGRMPIDGHEWTILIIGFVISFFVALAVVAWFMNWVRQRGFAPFAIYRIVVGIAVLVWVMRG
ncbi:MAG TPA: undecaprenyl-diphosphate phosphatase [Candidatus Angelobacter sp.]|nr:undecaprenyl-diphosphate phosphatase [Candidatus Angelobacter sp.]